MSRRECMAEREGWAERALDASGEYDRYEDVTDVGPPSLVRALLALRHPQHDAAEETDEPIPSSNQPVPAEQPPTLRPPLGPREVETIPAPPESNVRAITSRRPASGDDPLAVYIESLNEPAIEIQRAVPAPAPAPRRRRETVKMTPAMTTAITLERRQATLPMIDRPRLPPAPPAAPPPARIQQPFFGRASASMLALVVGLLLAALVVIAFGRLDSFR